MSINTREILTELVEVTEAGSSEAGLVAVAFKVAWEVNIDLAGQDLVEHCLSLLLPAPVWTSLTCT